MLAAVTPGRVARLALTVEQRQAFRDRDGRIALDVVRHLLGARAASVEPSRPPDAFPLTAGAFQAVALKLGHVVGIKRSRALKQRLTAASILEPAGSYRQPYTRQGSSGYRVRLYRLGVALRSALRRQRALGRGGRVKRGARARWWRHPLFGDLYGLPPPQLTRRAAARMRSRDEIDVGIR